LVENLNAILARNCSQILVAGQWSGGLGNSREQVTLMSTDQLLQQIRYADTWYPETDGDGASLEATDVASSNLDLWNQRAGWRAGPLGGSPGLDVANVIGDLNGDGRFDSTDLAILMASAEYEDLLPGNSVGAEGDLNGDGDFTSADWVYAFQLGVFQG
jgi:hypothetical protein